ncbi:hypothetical protein F5B18DRAFT_608707 [Nemania serpens]|nr:hypothetical protein F5B18DRAFT_608707 [Nemania serpens]
MSDQSDREDGGLSWYDEDPDASETELGDEIFDLEADESDGHDGDDHEDDDGGDDGDDYSVASKTYSFPRFSLLPPELRTMIWEAVDPDLKSQGRVLDFLVIRVDRPFWVSDTLAEQTRPARALLSANKESRYIALAHYPDVINIDFHGVIRFRSSSDIILLRTHQHLQGILKNFGRWCDNKIRYLAFGANHVFMSRSSLDGLSFDPPNLPEGCRSLEAVFYCFEGDELETRQLDWSVSESSKKFYRETYEDLAWVEGHNYKTLYCWPDTTLQADFANSVGDSYMASFPPLPRIGSIPVWPMAQYSFESGLELYRKVKRRSKRSVEPGVASSPESSEGESIYESELDDYAVDGFVVDSSSEGSEESSGDEHDEQDGVNVHTANSSGEHDDSFDEDGDEEDARFDHDPDAFNGFSPLQDPSDDEATSNLPNTTQAVDEPVSPEDLGSDASSLEDEPRATMRSSRRKRRIVSSDDEDDGENGGENGGASTIESNLRGRKRLRIEISIGEDNGDGGGDDAGPEVEGSFQSKKRARTIVSEHEDAEDEEDEEAGEEEEEEDDDDDDDDDDDEEPRASQPISLLAKLRQFRSEVRVSPEKESSNSGEEHDEEEQYESDKEEQVSDAEFPDSADEDSEGNGW